MKKKILLFLGVPIAIVVLSILIILVSIRLYTTPNVSYQEVEGYSDSSFIYACSKPIKVKVEKFNNGESWDTPVDPAEAKLFCHGVGMIEYKGKLTVLQRPEVLDLISHYAYKDVSIKALEFKYIQDPDFIHRLLPMYKDKEIGCIILLQTPDGGKVYLEDEDLQTFEEFDYATFMKNLDTVSAADKKLFLDNLK